jgi:alpha-tubulin suppressor-like RCC1 family protein
MVHIGCGWQHTIALSADGRVFSWGYGEDGQLGHGDTNDYLQPTQIQGLARLSVTQVECGHSHSGAIAGGEVYMWGLNPDSRLMIEGPETVTTPSLTLMAELRKEDVFSFEAVQISLGVTHSGVVTKSGEIFTAGSKLDGQLGSKFEDAKNLNET